MATELENKLEAGSGANTAVQAPTTASVPIEGGGTQAATPPGDFSYVPDVTNMPEFTAKSVILGVVMAVVLGAANAYIGLKAGMTISAAFPAAVIAIAAFRLPFFRGSILEQNMTRTTAAIGEALAAGAIFTIPAFVMVNLDGQRLWEEFHYGEATALIMVGGLLGILIVILLRRTIVVESDLPFPEAKACFEIVKAGQKGESGAKWVFGAMGVASFLEILKNSTGFALIKESVQGFMAFPKSLIQHYDTARNHLGDVAHEGGITFSTPAASAALMSVGYIIGPRIAAINFSGGVFAWLVLIPLSVFINPDLRVQLGSVGSPLDYQTLAYTVWYNQIRPLAVGGMLVGSAYTLYGLRNSLGNAFKGMIATMKTKKTDGDTVPAKPAVARTDKDLDLKWVIIGALVLIIPMVFLFNHFTQNLGGAILAAVVMTITGFLFAAVGGWLVGIVGNSNQPVSGLTLSTLIIAALLMVAVGIKGIGGVGAVLAIATVVCCVACMAGDMFQDLRVGQYIGGTPWKMEVGAIISTIVVSLVVVIPIIILHKANIASGGIGIGDPQLAAPQAGLMAQLASGIVGGNMPWGLVIMGMFFAVALILIKAPSPMLIAVGMYLPLPTTFAIFTGGVIKWLAQKFMERKKFDEEAKQSADNKGILVASGFIAGEAVTGVIMAGLVMLNFTSIPMALSGVERWAIYDKFGGVFSLLIFAVAIYALVYLPVSIAAKERAQR